MKIRRVREIKKGEVLMCIVDQVKKIATYICEALRLGFGWSCRGRILGDYQEISGVSEEEILEFERRIGMSPKWA